MKQLLIVASVVAFALAALLGAAGAAAAVHELDVACVGLALFAAAHLVPAR